ncbi:MAG: hypothetical protein IJ781_02790 [Atopobiaceae bacterium]|nr:hypothetical protein [Atopobiaceae bacterium]
MVDKELFDQYQHALGINADLLKLVVSRLVADTEGMTDQQRHLYLVANYPKWVRSFGVIAANAAADFYQRNRDRFFEGDDDADEYTAQTANPISAEWALGDISTAETNGIGTLPGIAVAQVMRRADRTMAYNVAHDPSHPRWAIVPNWGACGFCVLVASNGFFMHNRPVKVKRHDHCRCQVVADHDTANPSLEGYNPKAMQDAYSKCYDAVRGDLQRQWDALPDERKAKYLKKGGRGFDGFRRDQIVAEMNRRNREWLQDGVPRHRTNEPGAKPLKKERDVGTALLSHGFDVKFIKEVNRTNVKTADAYLNDELWEFKAPEGWNGEHTIRKQFFKAKDKGTSRLLISATKNGAEMSEMRKWVLETFRKGDYAYITEVMIVSADGESIERLLR